MARCGPTTESAIHNVNRNCLGVPMTFHHLTYRRRGHNMSLSPSPELACWGSFSHPAQRVSATYIIEVTLLRRSLCKLLS